MMGVLAARRARRRSTKRYLASIGHAVDRRTLKKMTRAADKRVPWYIRLMVALPGLVVLLAWFWFFRNVRYAGGSIWWIMFLMLLYVGLPVFLVIRGIRWLMDGVRHKALLHALREDFHIAVCSECGYDLRGSGGMAAKRCPECGTTFDSAPQARKS